MVNKDSRRRGAIICRSSDRPLAEQPQGAPLHIAVGLGTIYDPNGERGLPMVTGCEGVVRRHCRLGLGEVEFSPTRERMYRTRTGSIPKQRSLLPSPRGCLLSYLGRLHCFSLMSVPMSVLASMPHHTDTGRRQSAYSWALRVKSLGGTLGPPVVKKACWLGNSGDNVRGSVGGAAERQERFRGSQ